MKTAISVLDDVFERAVVVAVLTTNQRLAAMPAPADVPAIPTCYRQHIPPVLAGLPPQADYPPYPQVGPCYYEIGFPPSGTPVKGAMLMVGGGGFYSSPNVIKSVPVPASPSAQQFKTTALRWNSYGWITYSVEHSPQGLGVLDVRAFFDVLRSYLDAQPGYGPAFPVCTWGGSSGGHFALMVALMRPRVSCVVTEAAPTRLDQTTGATRAIVDWAFTGIGLPLPAFSPGDPSYPSPPNLTMPTLLGHYRNDPVVPLAQNTGFVASHPSAVPWIIEDGVPTCVDQAVYDESCLFTTHNGYALLTLWSSSMAEWRCREAALPTAVAAGTACLSPAPPGDYTAFASPTALTVPRLQSRGTTIGVVANAGFAGSVSLSAYASGLALGSSVHVTPGPLAVSPLGTVTATLTVSAGLLQLSGFTVTVNVTSGPITRSVRVPVAVG